MPPYLTVLTGFSPAPAWDGRAEKSSIHEAMCGLFGVRGLLGDLNGNAWATTLVVVAAPFL